MRRRLVSGTAVALLSAGLLAGASSASTKAVRLRVDAVRVPVSVACPTATASPGCEIMLELRTTAHGRLRGGMLVGHRSALVAPGQRRRIAVLLSRLGQRLLREHSPLPLIATTLTEPPAAPPAGTATTPAPATTAPGTSGLPPCVPGQPGGPPIGPHPFAGVGAGGGLATPLDCAN